MKEIKNLLLLLVFFQLGEMVSMAQTHGLKTVEIKGEKAIDEAAIESLAYQVLNAEKDEERLNANEELKSVLKNELSKKNAFTFPFEKVKSIVILTPKDSVFRLFNWNIPLNDGTYLYECGILKRTSPSTATLSFLTPITADSINPEQVSTANNEWFPSLFYEVIEKQTDLQDYYTLLAWDGNNRLSSKKSIDVLWFDQSGEARFGAPIFEKEGTKRSRVLFEFSAQNSMILNHDSKNNRILFDHLSPPNSSFEGVYEYYGADLSFDAYVWQKSKWIYQADVDADKGMKKSKKDFKMDKDIILEEQDIYTPK